VYFLLVFRKNFWLRLAGICGIFVPIFTLCLILLSINSYQFFNWESNALSDLGVISGNTAVFFNYALVGGGLLILFFVPGLFLILDNNFNRIVLPFFVLTCCFLIAIGLFPENIKPIHYLVSVGFFFFLPISLLLISGSFCFNGQLFWGFFTFIIAVGVTLPWILNFFTNIFNAVAIPEILSGLGVSLWIFTLGLRMLLNSAKKTRK
jgi:hypothetical membrane protein